LESVTRTSIVVVVPGKSHPSILDNEGAIVNDFAAGVPVETITRFEIAERVLLAPLADAVTARVPAVGTKPDEFGPTAVTVATTSPLELVVPEVGDSVAISVLLFEKLTVTPDIGLPWVSSTWKVNTAVDVLPTPPVY
jgi:hypothetical protein